MVGQGRLFHSFIGLLTILVALASFGVKADIYSSPLLREAEGW